MAMKTILASQENGMNVPSMASNICTGIFVIDLQGIFGKWLRMPFGKTEKKQRGALRMN